MAHILITGAYGFIGRHLARRLSESGHKVTGLGHGAWAPSELEASGLTGWVNGDISGANLRLLQQTRGTPDRVVHLAGGSSVGAALANPREDFFRTVATTVELLEWIRADAPATTLLAVSSAAVFGSNNSPHIREDTPLNPCSPYGCHKRLMEEVCRSYASSFGLRIVVGRLFSVYGPGLKKQLMWDICSRLSIGAEYLSLGGTGRELRDWTDVRDVCRALELISDKATSQVPLFNVGTGLGTPVRHVAQLFVESWTAGSRSIPVTFTGVSRPGDPFSLVADPGKLLSEGFIWQRSLEQGIADYVHWFRSIQSELHHSRH